MMSTSPVILIVEDEPNAVKLLQVNLQARGYQTITASHGSDALKLLNQHHVDLVLLDLKLPDMDGFEVCRKLRASSPTVRIIILSANGEGPAQTMALQAGADDYLAKPFGIEELLGRVKRI
jgi:DNA-binding response OmpR family regulator